MYDIIIIGGGPIGISLLYKFIKLKKYNILLLEKYELFNSFLYMDKNMIWHSEFNGCNIVENQFNNKIGHPTVEELLYYYNLFKNENIDDKFYKTNEEVYKIEDYIDNNYKIFTKNKYYITKIILICTRFNLSEPVKLSFDILNSNVNRYLNNSLDITNKNICIIGGSWTSADAIVELQKKNNVTLLTRNYNKFKLKHEDQKSIYGHKNFSINYKNIEYKQIKKIENNKIYVDDNIIKFDLYYIFFGYKNNNNIILNCNKKNIIDNSNGEYIELIENLYGCVKDHTKFNARYIIRENTINKIINLVEEKINC